MSAPRKIVITFTALLILAGAAAGAWWWQAGRVQARVAALLPALPDLAPAPAMLRARIAAADAEARGHAHAERGFATLARLYHANGFLDEAMHCYTGLEQLQPREPRWPHLHAVILSGYGEIEPALAQWQRVRALAPGYLAAQLRTGDSLLKINRPQEAAAAYEAALQLEPNNPYALLGLARLDLEAGRWEQARPRLEKVVSQTNFTLGYDLIVSLYERLGLTQRATEIRSMAKASGAYRDPADPWLDALIDDCLDPYRLSLAAGTIARNGDQAAARRLLERAVEVTPDNVAVLYQLGTLLIAQGDRQAAVWPLRRCTELSPDFADGWANLSALQASLGDTAAAERTLADGLRNCPQSPGLHLQYAQNLERTGRPGEAIAEYRASIRIRPNEPEAYLALGNLYLRQNRTGEGLAEIERALTAEPGNPTALGILALNAIMGGNEDEARRRLAAARAQPRVPREQMQQLVTAFRKQFGRGP
jgi:tetratricopeptide (TPR) repeat protein